MLTYKSESSIEQKKVIIIIIWSNNGYQLKIYLTVPWHCYKQKSEVLIFQNVSRTRGGSRTATTYKMERFVIIAAAVNYYHKALHLGCCSSPRPASDYRKYTLPVEYTLNHLFSGTKNTWNTQPAFTCSKLTIETLEQGVKYVKS